MMDLATATAQLADAGIGTPRVDAELLLAHVLGVSRSRLAAANPTAEQDTEFATLVARRATRVPLQHLTGTAPFRYLELAVGPGVFIPRPETELLV
jgi:release factor glutamine methyltransferase